MKTVFRTSLLICVVSLIAAVAYTKFSNPQLEDQRDAERGSVAESDDTFVDSMVTPAVWVDLGDADEIQLCQGCDGCDGGCPSCSGNLVQNASGPVKYYWGVDKDSPQTGGEKSWNRQSLVPWEAFGYGEYIGPYRTPHVGDYRIRINDSLQMVFVRTRQRRIDPYKLQIGDGIQITSASDDSLNALNVNIIPDGTIQVPLIGQVRASGKTVNDLQNELVERYKEYADEPSIVVQVTRSDTKLEDILSAVEARFGNGGTSFVSRVSPDGTIQLPLIGNIPAIGLTLDEIRREVNARLGKRVQGIEVTPVLQQMAPRFVYVVGEVGQPGRFEMNGPTSVTQALALAQGFNPGGNIRQIIVFRRDQNWRLMATKLDMSGALFGRKPHPTDEIWLRDSDIVLVPKRPIQRFTEAVDLYLTRGVYQVVPAFDFDEFLGVNN